MSTNAAPRREGALEEDADAAVVERLYGIVGERSR